MRLSVKPVVIQLSCSSSNRRKLKLFLSSFIDFKYIVVAALRRVCSGH